MKKARVLNWESYFMSVAIISSLRSKDAKTQNGAVVVDDHNRIIGIGYNGLPRGSSDDDVDMWGDADDSDVLRSKHTYNVHAERNAIYNALGRSLDGSSMYITLFPCSNCALTIIQTGVKKVTYLTIKPHHEAENAAVMKMFKNAGVECVMFDMSRDTEWVIADILATKKRLA